VIEKLWVKQFRNFDEFFLDFNHRKCIFIFGENNQGKTNFLEAIYFLANASSPIDSKIQHLIPFNKQESHLALEYHSENTPSKIFFTLFSNGDKRGSINGKKVVSPSSLRRKVNIEYISSDIIRIFQDGPEKRRFFLNKIASVYFHDYYPLYRKLEHILKQKNFELKTKKNKESIALWNEQLVLISKKIIEKRFQILMELKNQMEHWCRDMFEFFQTLSLSYHFSGLDMRDGFNEDIYVNQFTQKLKASFELELKCGHALSGPHRDDFIVEMNNQNLSLFYSRGINRTMACLLHGATLFLLKKQYGSFPVLLLDDAFSEVDSLYKKKLFHLFGCYTQFFYTSVLEQEKHLLQDPLVIRIQKGVPIFEKN